MALCRYLPVPSDRMGVIWSLLTIKESVVLEYGPAGTTHFSMGLFSNLGIDQENQLFTTHLDEEDVVMGDSSRLVSAVKEIDENLKPKVIFVIASSISSMIGTDVLGICNTIRDEVDAKMIVFTEGGLKGDYSIGIESVYNKLLKELPLTLDEVEKNEKSFNILGASMGEYRIDSDVEEIKRMMSESFGMHINCSMCTETSITDIENISRADINIVLSYEALEGARHLEETYGMPFVYILPYGYSATMKWLKAISEKLDRKINPIVMKRLMGKNMPLTMRKMYAGMMSDFIDSSYIYANYDKLCGLSNFMEEVGVTQNHLVCKHSLRRVIKLNLPKVDEIEYYVKEKDRLKVLSKMKESYVLADDISKHLMDKSNKFIKVSHPIMDTSIVAKHLPLMGERGADYILEYM